jgi:hypothetical protein
VCVLICGTVTGVKELEPRRGPKENITKDYVLERHVKPVFETDKSKMQLSKSSEVISPSSMMKSPLPSTNGDKVQALIQSAISEVATEKMKLPSSNDVIEQLANDKLIHHLTNETNDKKMILFNQASENHVTQISTNEDIQQKMVMLKTFDTTEEQRRKVENDNISDEKCEVRENSDKPTTDKKLEIANAARGESDTSMFSKFKRLMRPLSDDKAGTSKTDESSVIPAVAEVTILPHADDEMFKMLHTDERLVTQDSEKRLKSTSITDESSTLPYRDDIFKAPEMDSVTLLTEERLKSPTKDLITSTIEERPTVNSLTQPSEEIVKAPAVEDCLTLKTEDKLKKVIKGERLDEKMSNVDEVIMKPDTLTVNLPHGDERLLISAREETGCKITRSLLSDEGELPG